MYLLDFFAHFEVLGCGYIIFSISSQSLVFWNRLICGFFFFHRFFETVQQQIIRFDPNGKNSILLQGAWGCLIVSEPRNNIYCSVILWAKGTSAPFKLSCESHDGRRKYRSSDPEIIAASTYSSPLFASELEFQLAYLLERAPKRVSESGKTQRREDFWAFYTDLVVWTIFWVDPNSCFPAYLAETTSAWAQRLSKQET